MSNERWRDLINCNELREERNALGDAKTVLKQLTRSGRTIAVVQVIGESIRNIDVKIAELRELID